MKICGCERVAVQIISWVMGMLSLHKDIFLLISPAKIYLVKFMPIPQNEILGTPLTTGRTG